MTVINCRSKTTPPLRRYVYLAGAVEVQDTWRSRTLEKLVEMELEGINPTRGEELKAVGKHVKSDIPDKLLVIRDLNDLERTKRSAGFVIMNLNTTKEGRRPTATLLELMWCWLNQVPIIGIMGKECEPIIRQHPWIKTMISAEVSSVTAALELIEDYFL